MPQVRMTVGEIKCIRQADAVAKDDVYWIANVRSGTAVDQRHTDMARLSYDDTYASSLPEILAIGAGESQRFDRSAVYEREVQPGWYVFGAIHFVERDTPRGNYVARIAELLGIVVGGLVVAAAIGFGVGYWLGGPPAAFGAAIIAVAVVSIVGFLVAALIDLARPAESDAHLGGMPFTVGPLQQGPPDSDKDAWQLTLTPSGRLEVLDAHGAELTIYESSHHVHGVGSGHRYEVTMLLEISGGHR